MEQEQLKAAMDHLLKSVKEVKVEDHVKSLAAVPVDINISTITQQEWFKVVEHALVLGAISLLTEVSKIKDETFGTSTPIVVALAKIALEYLTTQVNTGKLQQVP